MTNAKPLQTYFGVGGNPHERGWIEVLVRRYGPGRYEQEPTGVIYAAKAWREMNATIGAKNLALNPPRD